ncbi:hypothetical protein STTU_6190 [Streptomyces sp. Tu6071]|uniref:DUF4190 domain-containing protein n=1 Tax=unclassified Streptomyces TaxID=2593676 RepID=UPI00020E6CB3|nr:MULTISPECIES: DUF4190 domain-containing protein [unclassified Streptomyces]ASY36195.1 hypothetical protein CAC01_28780 [Streptomyces sp. CLI2509]EGJ78979.1 hypothetical protein STTU_6190 [Streptomyces sp. Tu6071]MYX22553.1 DUF4190 domain-containing protein [Streptomyces sp. SID8380]
MSHSPEDSERPGGAGERPDLSKPAAPEQPPGERDPFAVRDEPPRPEGAPGPYAQAPGPYAQAPGPHGQAPGPYAQHPGSYAQGPGSYAQGPGPYGQTPGHIPGHDAWGGQYGGQWQGGKPPGGGMAVAALVCGIAAVVFCWTVVGGIILGVLGVVFGILALRRSRRTGAPNRGLGLAGIIVGAVGIVGGAITLGVIIAVTTSDDFQDSYDSFRNYSECLQHAQSPDEQRMCKEKFDRDLNG